MIIFGTKKKVARYKKIIREPWNMNKYKCNWIQI